MLLRSTALLNEPETAPELETDRRVYLLGNRAGSLVQSARVPVSSATELTAGLTIRQKIFIKNFSQVNLFVGKSNVSTSDGYLLRPKEELWVDLGADAHIYAVAASGTADVRVLEVGE